MKRTEYLWLHTHLKKRWKLLTKNKTRWTFSSFRCSLDTSWSIRYSIMTKTKLKPWMKCWSPQIVAQIAHLHRRHHQPWAVSTQAALPRHSVKQTTLWCQCTGSLWESMYSLGKVWAPSSALELYFKYGGEKVMLISKGSVVICH